MDTESKILGSGLAVMVALLGFLAFTAYRADPAPAAPPADTTLSPNSIKFLEMCTGIRIVTDFSRMQQQRAEENIVNLIAVANCLGRTRGYIDGHQMTVEVARINHTAVRQLWCVPQGTEDKDLLESVLAWTDTEPVQFKQLTEQYTGMSGALAVITRAVSQKYPCKNV